MSTVSTFYVFLLYGWQRFGGNPHSRVTGVVDPLYFFLYSVCTKSDVLQVMNHSDFNIDGVWQSNGLNRSYKKWYICISLSLPKIGLVVTEGRGIVLVNDRHSEVYRVYWPTKPVCTPTWVGSYCTGWVDTETEPRLSRRQCLIGVN